MWHRRQAGTQLRLAQGIGWMWLLPANNLPIDTNAPPQASTLAVKGERQTIFTRCSTSVRPGIEDRDIAVDTTSTLGALAAYYSFHAVFSDAVLAGPSCLRSSELLSCRWTQCDGRRRIGFLRTH